MTAERARAPRILTVAAAIGLALTLACGDDADSGGTEATGHPVVTGGPQVDDDTPASDACLRFCAKSNECAEHEGRRIPESARDCSRSCSAGGPHRLAPPAVLACVTEPCGEAFTRCTREAMLASLRDQDVAVFPPICQGLCARAAWCARRTHQPLGPGEDDCEAACREGGAYAGVSEGEARCANEPCGEAFTTCRANGGPASPAPPAPGPAPAGPPTAPAPSP